MTAWLQRLGKTKNGQIVFVQPPNGPLLVALGLSVARAIAPLPARTWFEWAALVAWLYWSGLELFSGVSPFRRILGGVVLVIVLAGFLRR